MNNDQHLSTFPVEYEDVGPRYSESYLARVERFQKMSSDRGSTNSASRSAENYDDDINDDRSVIDAPIRDFVEEDDKEAENISIPDRLCQPESPTVACFIGSPESWEGDIVQQIAPTVIHVSEPVKLEKQSSEEQEHTFGSLGPMNRMGHEVKESAAQQNRTRSQVSGWAKLFASTLQRSKSTVSQDVSLSLQKNNKTRPVRKSEQSTTSSISSTTFVVHDADIADQLALKTEMRKKKRSIGVDMREKLGFFRKPFIDSSSLPPTCHISNSKTSVSPSFMTQLEQVWKSTGGPPTKEQIVSWSHSFEDLLQDKHGISLFLEFLRSEFSDENLEFWSECEAYRSIDCPKKMQEKATQIYVDYIVEQSPREINIDSVTRIQTSLDIAHATANTFDQSQKKIQALMEKDSYQRFLRSDLFHSLATQMNAPTNCIGKLSHANSLPIEQETARVSYIPGLLPNVTSCHKSDHSHSRPDPSLLSITKCDTHTHNSSQDQDHHRSAPSSPKNTTSSTLS